MKVVIADYGVGNLYSISKGLERAGAETEIASDMSRLLDAECIVFPGVGAFGAAMDALRPVAKELKDVISEGVPTLGICLGMQILFDRSEESAGRGLSVLSGEVRKLKAARIPQMGWNDVTWAGDKLFEGVPQNSQFYFANSFVCHPEDKIGIASTDYGERFPSAVRKGMTFGVQFHPEKSGLPGLKLLSNFISIGEGRR
jgi:glutamine amidotransferase